MTTHKNDVFIGLQLKNYYLVAGGGAGELTFSQGNKHLVEGVSTYDFEAWD